MLFFLAFLACHSILVTVGGNVEIQADCSVCGLSGSTTMARIINGSPVKPRFKYPWIFPLMMSDDNTTFICGAAMITNNFLLTAAHCFIDESKTEYRCTKRGAPRYCYMEANQMNVGLMGTFSNHPKAVIPIKRIIVHPDYDSEDNTDDIALIEMVQGLRCNKFASPICLPHQPMRTSDDHVTIAGWGRYYQNPDYEVQRLREGRVRRVDPEVCQAANAKEKDKRKIFCTLGLDEGNQTSCQGDSGSSVFASFNDAFYSLGVTSIHTDGETCPVDGAVTFTNTFAYLDWIMQHVKHLPSPPPSAWAGAVAESSAGGVVA